MDRKPKTTLEQRFQLLERVREANPNWKSIQPEKLYEVLIRHNLLRVVRKRGRPPELRWL